MAGLRMEFRLLSMLWVLAEGATLCGEETMCFSFAVS